MDLVIVGAGGFGLEVATYLHDLARSGVKVRLTGYVDDTPGRMDDMPMPAPHRGAIAEYQPREEEALLIAIGDAVVRDRLYRQLTERGANFFTLVHPRAYLAESASLGPGTIVAPLAFVGPRARIAANCAINVHACVGHDASLEESATISPHAAVNGHASVGSASFVGTHATLAPKARLGAYSKLAAGAVLYGKTGDGVLAHGNPAQARTMFRPPT
jgi:sugar O-acyltransferase (sialic acid O-acetyltransferase NeuD family)